LFESFIIQQENNKNNNQEKEELLLMSSVDGQDFDFNPSDFGLLLWKECLCTRPSYKHEIKWMLNELDKTSSL